MFGPYLVIQYLVSFLVFQSSPSGRENCILLYFVFLLCLTVSVLCLFLAVLWVGLWYMIVALPGHTRLFIIENAKNHLHFLAVNKLCLYGFQWSWGGLFSFVRCFPFCLEACAKQIQASPGDYRPWLTQVAQLQTKISLEGENNKNTDQTFWMCRLVCTFVLVTGFPAASLKKLGEN